MINLHKEAYQEVFSKPRYIIIGIISSLLFFIATMALLDYSTLVSLFQNFNGFELTKLLFHFFTNFPLTVTKFSGLIIILTALLFGNYLSFAIYQTKQLKQTENKNTLLGSIGLFLGIIAPGCAACGLGIASFLGIGSFFLALPFKGAELSFIGVGLLLFVNLILAKKINQKTCEID